MVNINDIVLEQAIGKKPGNGPIKLYMDISLSNATRGAKVRTITAYFSRGKGGRRVLDETEHPICFVLRYGSERQEEVALDTKSRSYNEVKEHLFTQRHISKYLSPRHPPIS